MPAANFVQFILPNKQAKMRRKTNARRSSLAVVAAAATAVSGLASLPTVMAFGASNGVASQSTQNVPSVARPPMSFVGSGTIRKRPLALSPVSATRIAGDDHHDVHPHYNHVLQPMPFGQHSSASSTYTGYHKSSLATSTLSMAYDLTVDEYIRLPSSQQRQLPPSQKDASASSLGGLADIASAVMLITGNTVGAGMMAIPQISSGPGLGMSTALLGGE